MSRLCEHQEQRTGQGRVGSILSPLRDLTILLRVSSMSPQRGTVAVKASSTQPLNQKQHTLSCFTAILAHVGTDAQSQLPFCALLSLLLNRKLPGYYNMLLDSL